MMVPCLGISTVHHTTTHQTELRVAQRLPSPRPRRFWLEYASRWAVHLQLKHRRPAWDKWTSRQPASPKLRLQKAAFHWDRRPSSVWNRVGTRQDGPFSAWSRAALNCSSCLCPCSRACLARRVGPPFLCVSCARSRRPPISEISFGAQVLQKFWALGRFFTTPSDPPAYGAYAASRDPVPRNRRTKLNRIIYVTRLSPLLDA